MRHLEDVKAGDRVKMLFYLGSARGQFTRIVRVHHVTPTQIILDLNGNGSYLPRYNRSTGFCLGSRFTDYIGGVATKEECLEWDTAQAKILAKEKADAKRGEANERKIIELRRLLAEVRALFPHTSVESPGHHLRFTVSFENLTEREVRALAKRFK